jgi:PAS domain S-box-containing protein
VAGLRALPVPAQDRIDPQLPSQSMSPIDPSQPPILPDEAGRLAALGDLQVIDMPADPGLEVITRLAADRFDCAIALVSLVDSDRQCFVSRFGLDATGTPRADSFCAHAIAGDAVMVVPDASADPRFAANPLVTGAPHIRFYAAAPLVTGSYRVGTLCIIDAAPRDDFADRDAQALALMAGQVMALLESRRLRLSQQISQLIGQTTTDAFVCTDGDNRIIHWNRAAEKLFGWTEAEALGQPLDIIIPDRHRHGHANGVARLRRGGMPKLVGKTVEVPATCRDGREIPTELSLGMWPAPADGPPEGFAAIIRDVSARKALEVERAVTEARLAQQIAAIEASDDGIAVTDPEGRFIFMNQAHAVMFGHDSVEALIGQPWSVLYDAANARFLAEVAMPELGATGRWRGETRGRHKDGSAVPQEVALSLSADGGIVCVTRSIAARLAMEREKARLRDQLMIAQRQEAVGQLASGIAHDFNNLIAAIAGTASLMEKHAAPDVRHHAGRIQSAAATAAGLVDKLLTLGRRAPERKPVDVGAVLASVADLLTPGLADPQHHIELDLPAAPVVVEADTTELMQLVMNLALNARDALLPGREGCITLGLRLADPPPGTPAQVGRVPAGPSALIEVRDNGGGIAPGMRDQIFQPFFTAKGPTGTGLGLAVVAGIVADAGGAIAVHSTPGEGSSFDVWWPVAAAVTAGAGAPMDETAVFGLLAGKAVLVVDDNPAFVDTLVAMLEQVGAEPGPCLDAADALAAIEEDPDAWSLVITDYDMPGMSGAALAQAIRAIRADLPLLLLTALPNSFGRRAGDAALFDAVLGKPVGLAALLAGAGTAMAVAAQRNH